MSEFLIEDGILKRSSGAEILQKRKHTGGSRWLVLSQQERPDDSRKGIDLYDT